MNINFPHIVDLKGKSGIHFPSSPDPDPINGVVAQRIRGVSGTGVKFPTLGDYETVERVWALAGGVWADTGVWDDNEAWVDD